MIDPKDAMRWRGVQGGYWYYPKPEAIAEALRTVQAFEWDSGEAIRFITENFDAGEVTRKHLIPALEEATR